MKTTLSHKHKEFLEGMIQYGKIDNPLYVWIESVFQGHSTSFEEWAIGFRVRKEPPPKLYSFIFGLSREVAELISGKFEPEFAYVFSSLNNFETNERNFREFVTSSWEKTNQVPKILSRD